MVNIIVENVRFDGNDIGGQERMEEFFKHLSEAGRLTGQRIHFMFNNTEWLNLEFRPGVSVAQDAFMLWVAEMDKLRISQGRTE